MSFEGHYDGLCERGHRCGFSVLYCISEDNAQLAEFRCKAPVGGVPCGAELGWLVLVDDTNCESYGQHKYVKLTDAQFEECNLGHKHITTEATYKFSDKETYWDGRRRVVIGIKPVPKFR